MIKSQKALVRLMCLTYRKKGGLFNGKGCVIVYWRQVTSNGLVKGDFDLVKGLIVVQER